MGRGNRDSMDIGHKAEGGRLPFSRSAEETAIRAYAAGLWFLYEMEVINGKMGGFESFNAGWWAKFQPALGE